MTFLITHGYMEHGRKNWLHSMKKELIIHGDYNVVIMDWLTASGPPYTQATANTRLIGAMTAHFLVFLRDNAGLDLYKTHLIGHSLGAQAIGIFGQTITALTFQKVPRITGLDPARPYFETLHPSSVIKKEDAVFVDIIHTNSGHVVGVSDHHNNILLVHN